jgi:hypothetical protein
VTLDNHYLNTIFTFASWVQNCEEVENNVNNFLLCILKEMQLQIN